MSSLRQNKNIRIRIKCQAAANEKSIMIINAKLVNFI